LVIDSSVSYAFKAGLFTLWNFFWHLYSAV
jgi:hypothetical protein